MTTVKELEDKLRAARHDPNTRSDVRRWDRAHTGLTFYENHNADLHNLEIGRSTRPADAFLMFANWMELTEMATLMETETPIPMTAEEIALLETFQGSYGLNPHYTREGLLLEAAGANGEMRASERVSPDWFRKMVQDQYMARLRAYKRQVIKPYEQLVPDGLDEDDVIFDLFFDRDRLEYAHGALVMAQMDTLTGFKRLPNMDAKLYLESIELYDDDLRDIWRKAQKDGLHVVDPIAPETFWWRQPAKRN